MYLDIDIDNVVRFFSFFTQYIYIFKEIEIKEWKPVLTTMENHKEERKKNKKIYINIRTKELYSYRIYHNLNN